MVCFAVAGLRLSYLFFKYTNAYVAMAFQNVCVDVENAEEAGKEKPVHRHCREEPKKIARADHFLFCVLCFFFAHVLNFGRAVIFYFSIFCFCFAWVFIFGLVYSRSTSKVYRSDELSM